jgi:hypothetical protein
MVTQTRSGSLVLGKSPITPNTDGAGQPVPGKPPVIIVALVPPAASSAACCPICRTPKTEFCSYCSPHFERLIFAGGERS